MKSFPWGWVLKWVPSSRDTIPFVYVWDCFSLCCNRAMFFHCVDSSEGHTFNLQRWGPQALCYQVRVHYKRT